MNHPQLTCNFIEQKQLADMFGVPGLHPGPHALFEVGYDLVGYTGVYVLPGCAVHPQERLRSNLAALD